MDKNKISEDRKRYLRRIVKRKILILSLQILTLVIFISGWEFLANKGVIDSFITSKPSRIVNTFMNLTSNGLLKHVGYTCFETIVGFSLGTFMGIIIAIVLWWSKLLAKIAEPFLVVLNSLPKVALRTDYHHLGRSRDASYYCNGFINLTYCYNFRDTKWISKYG